MIMVMLRLFLLTFLVWSMLIELRLKKMVKQKNLQKLEALKEDDFTCTATVRTLLIHDFYELNLVFQAHWIHQIGLCLRDLSVELLGIHQSVQQLCLILKHSRPPLVQSLWHPAGLFLIQNLQFISILYLVVNALQGQLLIELRIKVVFESHLQFFFYFGNFLGGCELAFLDPGDYEGRKSLSFVLIWCCRFIGLLGRLLFVILLFFIWCIFLRVITFVVLHEL